MAQEIVADGGIAVADGHDVSTDGGKIIEHAVSEYGGIDILINNAGQLRDRSFAKMTWDEWEDVINTHLHGTFRCTHAAWPHMVARGYGRVLMISSLSAVSGNFGQGPLCIRDASAMHMPPFPASAAFERGAARDWPQQITAQQRARWSRWHRL